LADRGGQGNRAANYCSARQGIAARSLADNGATVLVRDMEEAVVIINRFAPEHLEVLTENPLALLGRIRHAGSVFLGPYSPEAAGDYTVGPSHVLPTGGTARFYSALGVDSFVKHPI
jgi:histidinol dehydrogenase